MSTRRNLVFRFSATEQGGGTVIRSLEEEDAEEEALSIMTTSTQSHNHFLISTQPRPHRFSDLRYYQRLCAESGCVKVRMSRVRCLYSRYFMGIEVVYRSTFANGTTQERKASERSFESGYYSYKGGTREDSALELEEDEFITGLRLNQGEIVDGVTFVTNRREVHFGGHGGRRYDMMLSRSLNAFRIVAFTGTESGVMHRIGYFAESISWETIRPLVMLRWLVERKRAAPTDAECTNDKLVVRALVGAETSDSLPDEIFRHVLRFLIDSENPHRV
jgi:hypothetical protein